MATKKKEAKTKNPKPPKNYHLINAIRGKKQKNIDGESFLYKANVKRRDAFVRKFVEGNVETANAGKVFPGQLVMFNYFQPKTKESLEYYDAMPCTIFFGVVNSKEGKRVLGFNLHYYPPRIRFQIIDRIFEIFKPLYLESWEESLSSEMSDFNYKMLMRQLQDAKLDFGVRMYIPSLIHKVAPIPPMYWQKAVFTEGHFKKQTREQILKYWKERLSK
jgi:hypothetical protein